MARPFFLAAGSRPSLTARRATINTILKLLLAVVIAVVLLRIGFAILRGLARPLPEPPPPGEMRKVNFRYRCSICGAEARLTLAADEDPDPPRHCQDEMQLVTPVDD